MKTVHISSRPISAAELLEMAKDDPVLVKTANGDSFVVTHADEFDTEVQLLRRNHAFLAMLDGFKKNNESIPLDEVEKQLR